MKISVFSLSVYLLFSLSYFKFIFNGSKLFWQEFEAGCITCYSSVISLRDTMPGFVLFYSEGLGMTNTTLCLNFLPKIQKVMFLHLTGVYSRLR